MRECKDQSTEIDNRQDYFPQSSDYDVRRDSNNFQPNHNSFHRDHSDSAQRNQSNLSHSGFMKDRGSNVALTHDYRQTNSSSFLFVDNFTGPSLPDEESFNGGPSKHTYNLHAPFDVTYRLIASVCAFVRSILFGE